MKLSAWATRSALEAREARAHLGRPAAARGDEDAERDEADEHGDVRAEAAARGEEQRHRHDGQDLAHGAVGLEDRGVVLPELNGKLTGMSFRVPVNDVSVVDLTAKLVTKTNYADIMDALEEAAHGYMKGVLTCLDADVVSSDLRGDPHTCIVDKRAGIMLGDDFVKLIAWYDNEWGYSSKVLDMVEYVADK